MIYPAWKIGTRSRRFYAGVNPAAVVASHRDGQTVQHERGGLSRIPIWKAMAQKAKTLLGGISLLAQGAALQNSKRAATKPSQEWPVA